MSNDNGAKLIRVYMLGSGPIAVPVLNKLAGNPRGLQLVGVGTQTDRPAGRKKTLQPTVLGARAAELGVAVDKIADINAPEVVAKLTALSPDVLLVVSFGQLLKEAVLNLPGCRCVNIHASLLPKYRGASPIASAIRNGDSATGVGFMQMARALDAGPVYRTLRRELNGTELADSLEIELGELAAAALEETLSGIVSGEYPPIPQDESRKTICRKISKNDGNVDWNESTASIERKFRAYYPWPGIRCAIATPTGSQIVALQKVAVRADLSGVPGSRLNCGKNRVVVACGEGALEILELAPAGSRTMPIAAFLNGIRNAEISFPPMETN